MLIQLFYMKMNKSVVTNTLRIQVFSYFSLIPLFINTFDIENLKHITYFRFVSPCSTTLF